MELRHLKTFTVVAECHGFTRAGILLGYTQSTITHHIHILEEEIGSPLFDRLGKKVVLTDSGKHLLSYAKEILRLSQEALQFSSREEQVTGTIRIGANESLMVYRLPSLLYEFKKRYPKVQLILQPNENWELHNKLKSGEVDLSFYMDTEKSDPTIMSQNLVQETLILLSPPQHKLTQKKIIVPSDLEAETLLVTEPSSYRDLIELWIKKENVTCHQIDFWSIEAIKHCVMIGLGISYLPWIAVAKEIEQGKLVALPWVHTEDFFITQLAYHKDKWLTPAMKKLLQLVEVYAKEWVHTPQQRD